VKRWSAGLAASVTEVGEKPANPLDINRKCAIVKSTLSNTKESSMSKSYRFDPEEDFGGDNLPPKPKKELKAERQARRSKDAVLDDQMQPDEDSSSERAW